MRLGSADGAAGTHDPAVPRCAAALVALFGLGSRCLLALLGGAWRRVHVSPSITCHPRDDHVSPSTTCQLSPSEQPQQAARLGLEGGSHLGCVGAPLLALAHEQLARRPDGRLASKDPLTGVGAP